MRDTFPFFDIIVLPTDAGPNDPRIELDGTTNEIRVYDNNGDLVAIISPDDGFTAYEPNNTDQYAAVKYDTSLGQVGIIYSVDDIDQTGLGFIVADVLGIGGTRNAWLRFGTPALGGNSSSQIHMLSASEDGTEMPNVLLDLFPAGGALVYASSIPGGFIDEFVGTTNQSYSATGVTDTVINNVPLVAGRKYDIHLHTQWNLDSLASWRWSLRVDGTIVDRFKELNSAATTDTLDSWCRYEPTVTSNTSDLDLHLTELAGASTLTLQADATINRRMTIYDAGAVV